MLTENEAKEKWCPFVRTIAHALNGDTHAANRAYSDGVLSIERSCCIGSECMAWRRRYADDAKEAKISHVTGYCGLAGKP